MPWEPLPGTRQDPKLLAGSLDDVLRRLSGPSAASTVTVFTHWEDMVGERLATHSNPLKLEGDVLVVGVSDPAWASEFKWMEANVLEKIHKHTATTDLKRLKVVVSPDAMSVTPE